MILHSKTVSRSDIRTVGKLIEETNDAYRLYSKAQHVNADFAEFASLSLRDFKHKLQAPNLTARNLRHLIRAGMKHHTAMNGASLCHEADPAAWVNFMSHYVTQNANAN
jgi:hypothetical protein